MKYSRGAVKAHTLLNLRGNIPEFIHITDGKYHDSNVLDIIVPQSEAIYLMDSQYSIYEITQILRIFTFDKTPICDLIANFQIIQNKKDRKCDLFAGIGNF